MLSLSIKKRIFAPNKMLEMKEKITEQPSHFDHLERMSVKELLQHINEEDCCVAEAVKMALPQIEALVEAIETRMRRGGRLFYVGAGTSGRLGVLDASELPPTFGVPDTWVIGIIAGGDKALRHAVERAEDDAEQGWKDLQAYHPSSDDTILGIAASGTTPYVIGAVRQARQNGLLTGCITSNPHSPLAQAAEFAIEIIVGPEFLTGSSRMKSGTAQKMVLNMISTSLMIRMGRVLGNRMVNMQLTNDKLVDRGTRMLQESLGLSYDEARRRLMEVGSVNDCLMMRRTIRKATEDDLPRIMELIECGRQKMRAVGNMDQWTDGNPRQEVIQHDIELGNSYLVEEDGVSVATFAFIKGPDVTYNRIYEGQWLDEPKGGMQSGRESEYWVVHRMASVPEVKGIFKTVLDYCFTRTTNIRIDTHRQNIIMRSALEKYGFSYCGIIYLLDGAERLAYQRCIEKTQAPVPATKDKD